MKYLNDLKKIKIILMFFVILSSNFMNAQIEYPEDKAKWKFSLEQKGGEATIIAEVKMETHWHINSIVLPKGVFGLPTTFKLTKASTFKTVGNVIEPKAIVKHDDASDEDLSYHEGKILLKQKIKVTSEKDFVLTGTFSFQTCDATHCLAPYDGTFKVNVKGLKSIATSEVNPINDQANSDDSVNEMVSKEIVTVTEANSKLEEKTDKIASK